MSQLTEIDSVAGISIYQTSGTPKAFVYRAGFAINADGSPNCYGPENSGIDYTANGGTPGGDWWGGPTEDDGMPCVQKIYDPSPGMYVCGTALVVPHYTDDSQYRYIDSESIPFFVLPGQHNNGAKLGDVGLVFNYKTGDNCYAIYADVGPSSKIGEGSIRLAEALSLDPNPKAGGTESQSIVYLVFPGSIGKWTTPKTWFHKANEIVGEWGGLGRLMEIADTL